MDEKVRPPGEPTSAEVEAALDRYDRLGHVMISAINLRARIGAYAELICELLEKKRKAEDDLHQITMEANVLSQLPVSHDSAPQD